MKKEYAAVAGVFGRGAHRHALVIGSMMITLAAFNASPPASAGAPAYVDGASASLEAQLEYQASRPRAHQAEARAAAEARRVYVASRVRAYREAVVKRAIVQAQLEYQASRTRAYRQAEAARRLVAAQLEYQASRIRAYAQGATVTEH